MNTVVEKYPNSRLSEMAGMIVNGVNAGKRLYGGKFDLSNVWSMRSDVINNNDSTQHKGFSDERNDKFVFLLAYVPDSVNENQLLFEVAKYNFTSYMARNFDLNIEGIQGLHRLKVSGFRNYDEARQYANEVYKQTGITRLLNKARAFVISEPNLELLGTKLSYDDYDKFYDKHFAPLKISQLRLLIEPAEIAVDRDQEDASSKVSETGDHPLDELEPKEDLILGPVNQNSEQQKTQEEEITLPVNKEEQTTQEEEFTLPVTKEEQKTQEDEDTFEIQPQQKEEKTEDTGIDFEEKKPEDSGLEDEYFELDGF